ALPRVGGQGVEDRLAQRQRSKAVGDVLLDKADAQSARAHDVARGQALEASDAAQERGLAAAIAGHKADAVTIGDDEIEIGEERRTRSNAGGGKTDRAHDVFSG